MDEDRELKFVCKLCNKKYPCGKSLGGHMRSHVIANLAESDENKVEQNMKRMPSLNNFDGGKFLKKESKFVEQQFDVQQNGAYGLRENRKKTWRAVDSDFPLPQEKACKQCGKVFQSLKALCGHMACHSEKEKGGSKDDHSWTSENHKLVLDSHSDTEAEDRKLRSKSKAAKRYKRIVIKSSSFSVANCSSSVSEIDEQEQEEVAMCLMMLSRNSCNKGGVNSVVESSDNNSVVLESKSSSIEMRIGRRESLIEQDETIEKKNKIGGSRKLNSSVLDTKIVQQENSDSGYFLGEATNGESNASSERFCKNAAFWEWEKPKISGGIRTEDSVSGMKKGLKSKGHKIELSKENGLSNGGLATNSVKFESKKRSNACFGDPGHVAESCKKIKYGSSNAEVAKNAYKRNRYECLNCKKIFKSFQALGGHRPCHKRINACLNSRYDTCENSSDADNDIEPADKLGRSFGNDRPIAKDVPKKSEKKMRSKKHKGHACPFCNRVFKSGQALGGHKRSHFLLGGSGESSSQSPVVKPEIHDLFDLNLPAPVEDEDAAHLQFASC